MELSKWDRWRALVLWWNQWIMWAVKIASQASIRVGTWLVSPIVKDQYVNILENQIVPYNMRIFGINWFDENGLTKVLSLLEESNSLWYGVGMDCKQTDIVDFTVELFNRWTKAIIFDWQVTGLISNNLNNLHNNTTHLIILNKKEINNFFWKITPNNSEILKLAKSLNSYLLLKWEHTKIISPNWSIEELYTWNYPQMLVAWSWDVLLWMITWFIAQWKSIEESIKLWIKVRELAVQNYIEKTWDIIATPNEIVDNVRYIIWKII